MCTPIWQTENVTECPYGHTAFIGLVTWPSAKIQEELAMGLFGVIMNTVYSYMPFILLLIFLLRCVFTIIRARSEAKQEASGRGVSDKEKLEELERKFVHTVKIMIFGLIMVILNSLQKWLFSWFAFGVFLGQRPKYSCLRTCGFPSGEAVWSYGLFTMFTLDAMMGWSLRLLTPSEVPKSTDSAAARVASESAPVSERSTSADLEAASPGASPASPMLRVPDAAGEKASYTNEEVHHLGYRVVPTSEFNARIVLNLAVLTPVPFSRTILQDATYSQIFVGMIEGLLVGVVFHVLFVYFFRKYRAFKMRFLSKWLLAPILRREHFQSPKVIWNELCVKDKQDIDDGQGEDLKPESQAGLFGASCTSICGLEFFARDISKVVDDNLKTQADLRSKQEDIKKKEIKIKSLHATTKAETEKLEALESAKKKELKAADAEQKKVKAKGIADMKTAEVRSLLSALKAAEEKKDALFRGAYEQALSHVEGAMQEASVKKKSFCEQEKASVENNTSVELASLSVTAARDWIEAAMRVENKQAALKSVQQQLEEAGQMVNTTRDTLKRAVEEKEKADKELEIAAENAATEAEKAGKTVDKNEIKNMAKDAKDLRTQALDAASGVQDKDLVAYGQDGLKNAGSELSEAKGQHTGAMNRYVEAAGKVRESKEASLLSATQDREAYKKEATETHATAETYAALADAAEAKAGEAENTASEANATAEQKVNAAAEQRKKADAAQKDADDAKQHMLAVSDPELRADGAKKESAIKIHDVKVAEAEHEKQAAAKAEETAIRCREKAADEALKAAEAEETAIWFREKAADEALKAAEERKSAAVAAAKQEASLVAYRDMAAAVRDAAGKVVSATREFDVAKRAESTAKLAATKSAQEDEAKTASTAKHAAEETTQEAGSTAMAEEEEEQANKQLSIAETSCREAKEKARKAAKSEADAEVKAAKSAAEAYNLKQKNQLEKKKREEAAKLNEEIDSAKHDVQTIRDFSENLNKIQGAIDKGSLQDLQVAHDDFLKSFNDNKGKNSKAVDQVKTSLKETFVKQATQKLGTWNDLWKKLEKMKDEMCPLLEKAAEDANPDLEEMRDQANKLFTSLEELNKSGLVLSVAEEEKKVNLRDGIKDGLRAWQKSRARAKDAGKENEKKLCEDVQKMIICMAVDAEKNELRHFDFVDLDSCLEFADLGSKEYLELAKDSIESLDKERKRQKENGKQVTKGPSEMKGMLSNLSTLLFFLEFIAKESISETKKAFLDQLEKLKITGDQQETVKKWITKACGEYESHNGLLNVADDKITAKTQLKKDAQYDAAKVITKMDNFQNCDPMLAEIFKQIAQISLDRSRVVTVLHHTQVIALMTFAKLLGQGGSGANADSVKTLIARVQTGEGKSMLIAALAVYVVLKERKRVHVIGGNEHLTQRDFESYTGLFGYAHELMLQHQGESGMDVPPKFEDFAAVCGVPSKNEDQHKMVKERIPDDAWIVYCEAKHVKLYYTAKAKSGEGFRRYNDTILVIDEVDSLVVDEAPSDKIGYDVGEHESKLNEKEGTKTFQAYAIEVGRCLNEKKTERLEELKPDNKDDTFYSIYNMLTKNWATLVDQASEVEKPTGAPVKSSLGSTTTLKYKMHDREREIFLEENGTVKHDAIDNHLESLRLCVKLQKGNSNPRMSWWDPLFVVSKPRAFLMYSKIVGLSGTIGNSAEQKFLMEAYGAAFFEVPPFLKTCVDPDDTKKQLFHTTKWADKAMHEPLKSPFVVMDSSDSQHDKIKELAFEARRKVPVLIIAKDTEEVNTLCRKLRQRLKSGEGSAMDVVLNLSQASHPADYKKNLQASTRPLQKGGLFRITVTDPAGGRGVDYKMTDKNADVAGGMMVVATHIPLSERDWIQYLGRTARQDKKGQYCVVLSREEPILKVVANPLQEMKLVVGDTVAVKRSSGEFTQDCVVRVVTKDSVMVTLPADSGKAGEQSKQIKANEVLALLRAGTKTNKGWLNGWLEALLEIGQVQGMAEQDSTNDKALSKQLEISHEKWCWFPNTPDDLQAKIFAYRTKESETKLGECDTDYKSGFIANDICENVWAVPEYVVRSEGRNLLTLQPDERKEFKNICSQYAGFTAQQLEKKAGEILKRGNKKYSLPSQPQNIKDYKRDEKFTPPMARTVVLVIDRTAAPAVRDVCFESMAIIFKDYIQDDDEVGLYSLGEGWIFKPTLKLDAKEQLQKQIEEANQWRGDTVLYRSLLQAVTYLKTCEFRTAPWLIVLTDLVDLEQDPPIYDFKSEDEVFAKIGDSFKVGTVCGVKKDDKQLIDFSGDGQQELPVKDLQPILKQGSEGALSTETRNRLAKAKARTGLMTFSLKWDTTDDLDLCLEIRPDGVEEKTTNITYSNKVHPEGRLDVDANADKATAISDPVENIFLEKCKAGKYTVTVKKFGEDRSVPFEMILRTRKKVNTDGTDVCGTVNFQGVAKKAQPWTKIITVPDGGVTNNEGIQEELLNELCTFKSEMNLIILDASLISQQSSDFDAGDWEKFRRFEAKLKDKGFVVKADGKQTGESSAIIATFLKANKAEELKEQFQKVAEMLETTPVTFLADTS